MTRESPIGILPCMSVSFWVRQGFDDERGAVVHAKRNGFEIQCDALIGNAAHPAARSELVEISAEFSAKLPADFVAARWDHRQRWPRNWRRERDSNSGGG
jgi:hypothetical protein